MYSLIIGKSNYIKAQTVEFIPTVFALQQNFPNPFNPATTIQFSLPQDAFVSLRLFDLLGREVETLVSGFRIAGVHQIFFDAKKLSSGTYLYKLTALDLATGKQLFSETRKMMLVK